MIEAATRDILRPDDAAQVADAIRDAAGPLAIEGGGGLAGLGRPIDAVETLKLDRLTGVVEYSPTELYASFRAGTTLADAKAALAEKNQRLPFDPPDLTGLYGPDAGPATIGGGSTTPCPRSCSRPAWRTPPRSTR